jgi:hypothetical protein
MRPGLARPSPTLAGNRLAITAGIYEGEGNEWRRALSRDRFLFISPQDDARNHLLHALYAPRKCVSANCVRAEGGGMRDTGYVLRRIPILRTSVNKGKQKDRKV